MMRPPGFEPGLSTWEASTSNIRLDVLDQTERQSRILCCLFLITNNNYYVCVFHIRITL